MIFNGKTKNRIMRKMNNVVECSLSTRLQALNHLTLASLVQKALPAAWKIALKTPTLLKKMRTK